MSGKILAYIREQPRVWREILSKRDPITAEFRKAHGAKAPGRIVIIGSGSSHYAAQIAAELFEAQLGLRVTAVIPTRMANSLALAGEDTLFWVVSQSGKSTSTLSAIQAVHKAGFPVTALTGDAASPVAAACERHVLIDCGEEAVGPKTKGMSATILTLYLMGLALPNRAPAGFEARLLADIARSADAAADNIRAATAWLDRCGAILADAPHMILVADGINTLVAREAALKVLENLYIPVCSYEFEEYLHGLQYTIDGNSYLAMLVGDGPNRERMLRLAEFHASKGGHHFVVSCGSPCFVPGELFLETSGNPYTLPFETLLPFQLMGALIPARKGYDNDVPRYPEFYGMLETKV